MISRHWLEPLQRRITGGLCYPGGFSALLCFSCLFVLHLGIYNATLAIVVIDIVAVTVCVQGHESYYPTPPHSTPAVTDDERAVPVAVPVCVQEHERYYPTPPHPSSNWWWKTTACSRACVCTGTWTLLSHTTPHHPSSNWWWKTTACCSACVCTGTWTLLSHPHPTPAVTDDERAVPLPVPVCVQEHERYYPTPPHPSSNWWWKTTACCSACVCTGTWTLLSHPTPPHPSSNWWWKTTACCRACYRNMNVIIPPHPTAHPTPAVTDDERPLPVPVPVCVLEHERYYPTPPRPTPHHPSSNTNVPKSHCRKWSVYNVW